MTAAFWTGAALGLFSGTITGVLLACIFASARVTQAEAEAQRWREACDRAYQSGWTTRQQLGGVR